MGVDAHGQAVFFGPHLRHMGDAVAKAAHSAWSICSASSARPAVGARRGEIESIRTRCSAPWADQRLAGAHSAVQHVIPLVGIVEGAEHHAADQLQPMLIKRLGQDRGVLGHEAHRTKLDAGIACLAHSFSTVRQAGCGDRLRIPRPRNRARCRCGWSCPLTPRGWFASGVRPRRMRCPRRGPR
jgi:hypothetical protein